MSSEEKSPPVDFHEARFRAQRVFLDEERPIIKQQRKEKPRLYKQVTRRSKK